MIFLRVKNKPSRLLRWSFIVLLLHGFTTGVVSATEFSASFKNADINEFINIVGKNLNKTIILDPAVRGNINVRSYDLLNDKQYFQFFLNVLEVYGFAVVEMDNNIYKVVKAKDAKVAAIPVVDDEQFSGDEMVTRVVPVTNVSVRELAPLLRQLNDNAGGGNVVHYDPSNVIMITGRAAVVNRLVQIIQRVDKAGDQEVDIVKLNYASAIEMVRVLEAIQQPADGTKSSTPSILKPRLVADERTNSVIISGEPKTRVRIVKLVKSLDNELVNNGNTRVFYLKYAKAKDVVNVLKGVSKSIEKTGTKSTESSLSIEAHEGTNSLVVSAQPALMTSLSSVIRQLDIRRAQVLIEAIVVEVSENDGIKLGTQWAAPNGGTQFKSENTASLGNIVGGIDKYRKEGSLTEAASAIANLAGGIVGYAGADWGVVLQAISSTTGSNILATPSITTLDNQEASFIVGDEVPVLTGTNSNDNGSNPFQTIERKSVGIKLKVTPQINEGDAVQMVIEQEVSSIKKSTDTAVDVIFSTRAVKTTVLAKSGDTVVIGGLIDEKVIESVNKVPLFGDIPLLGHLFKSTESGTEKRNLMVFIRATIIRDDQTMNHLSTRKYGLIREIQKLQSEDGIDLMPNTDTPILPQWGESHEINLDNYTLPKKSSTKNNEQQEGL